MNWSNFLAVWTVIFGIATFVCFMCLMPASDYKGVFKYFLIVAAICLLLTGVSGSLAAGLAK